MKQGILTKEEYLIAKEKYSKKISELEKRLDEQKVELKNFEEYISFDNRWMKAFLQFRNTNELTREMAVELLDKVELYGDKQIHIRFRFRNEYEFLMSHLIPEDKWGEKNG